jgi:hypothetical protein
MTREEFEEERAELRAQVAAGELDIGLDDPQCDLDTRQCWNDLSGLRQAARSGVCFQTLCNAFGVKVNPEHNSVRALSDQQLLTLRQSSAPLKIYYEYYSESDKRNHVVAVDKVTNSARVVSKPVNGFSSEYEQKCVGVTSPEQFFNRSNMYCDIQFFADVDEPAAFGADAATYQYQSRRPDRERSIVDDRSSAGQANVAGGVKRAKRRIVASKSKFSPSGHVAKSYAASSGVMFNNLNEMFQDTISRDYAQEIIEQVFEHWGVPSDEPAALKYAEDLIWAFFIATTASNKADYDFAFVIPCDGGEIDAEFSVLSKTLAEQFGVTRRQFARGVADDMRRYIKDPDNVHLRAKLADRAGCDPQMSDLAFDGSTHCSGLTSAQLTFTKLLESRNLFEDEAVLSQGSSGALMEGIHGRVKSKVQR